jgi:tRNA (cmo5U34)-methyltransferase
MSHSVENHLRVTPADYDRSIRELVPHYVEMIDAGVEILAALAPRAAHVLDLGGGTGALTQAVLTGLPTARVTLLDIDPRMLEQARARLSGDARVDFVEQSFTLPLPRAEVVVASLSLHHIHELSAKQAVYQAIHTCLSPGGLFLNLDAAVSDDPRLRELTYARWARVMGAHGIDEATARGHFAAWSREDTFFPLYAELGALDAAGFAKPECFWRKGQSAVIGGLKSGPRASGLGPQDPDPEA